MSVSSTSVSVSSTSLTELVASFTVEAMGAAGSPERRAAATDAIIDSIGVSVAGGRSETAEALAAWTGFALPHFQARGWNGVPIGAPPEVAAMIMGAHGHALDFDDALPGAGHPSNILVSAILAATGGHVTGAELLDAFIVGYEVNARLARAVGHKHYLHGWHTTSTVGALGAAAASSAALHLDVERTRTAFGIAASLVSGLQRNFGSMTKPLHAGLAARHGVLAAALAAAGLTASTDVLDGARGFFDVYAQGGFRPDAFDGIGVDWAIVKPGSTVKLYPAALEVVRAVEAAGTASARLGVTAEEIVSIDCGLPPGTTGPLLYDRPVTGDQGKFSLPYTVAAAVIGGTLTLADFEDAAVRRPEVARLMTRIHVTEDESYRPEDPSGRNSSASFGGFVEVTVSDHAGHRETVRVDQAIGSPSRRLTAVQRREKFVMCLAAAGHFRPSADAAFDALTAIVDAEDVGAVLDAALAVPHPEPKEQL